MPLNFITNRGANQLFDKLKIETRKTSFTLFGGMCAEK